MEYFVEKDTVVRQIWGKSDTILFIFAGASAEFALNKAVDWLYFTGRLPADPLGRLFSTVSYAQTIVFAEKQAALAAIDKMAAIHAGVESKRGKSIPDWAYRDVLFMLIDYSIRSFELLERKLDLSEKEEVFSVFFRVGQRMNIKDLP
ncbi:MAG: oxygenase MpaB family protein, partial [Salegentibacter sp.]